MFSNLDGWFFGLAMIKWTAPKINATVFYALPDNRYLSIIQPVSPADALYRAKCKSKAMVQVFANCSKEWE